MNEKSRTENSIRNIFTGLFGQGLQVLLSFINRMVFIRCLSADYLGLNGLFTNVLSVLSLAELGIGSAIVYALYKPLAEKDEKKIAAYMNFYARAYKTIGIIVAVAGIIMPKDNSAPINEKVYEIVCTGAQPRRVRMDASSGLCGAAPDIAGLRSDQYAVAGRDRQLYRDDRCLESYGIFFCLVFEYAHPSAAYGRNHFQGDYSRISQKGQHSVYSGKSDPGGIFRDLSSEHRTGRLHGASGIPARISGREIRNADRADVPALPL